MKKLSYYRSLPESMSVEQLFSEFLEFVEADARFRFDGNYIVDVLLELSERQWGTYTLLDNSLRSELDRILVSHWDGRNFDFVEGAISITARLGLVGFFDFISNLDAVDLSSDVVEEIRSAVSEFGETVGDPYSGMR
ncbi:hypothetical protein AB3464_03175 [Pseudomonas asplenii]|uniref:hypothetical protein n=1 Tax=Pseudomonas asplenii TaxID=53407 RepID=UPI0037C65F11